MSNVTFSPWAKRFVSDTNALFWALQVLGWFGLSLISFFSLTLWYDQQTQLTYVGHTLVQSLLGILVSWPLRPLSHKVWEMSFWRRFSWLSVGIFIASGVWALLRITTFMAMTGEEGLWPDFGGWLFGSILIFVSWASFYHGIKYYQLLQSEHSRLLMIAASNKEEQLKRAQAETVAREAQLKMLRYQLNPHFLFNTLNAISSLVQSQDENKANSMIVQLSRFLRYSLDNDPVGRVTLKEEIDALQLYLSIEKTRFGDRLELDFDVDPDAQDIRIPSLILQPLAENAIKYAIAPMENGGKIKVKASQKGDSLLVELSDSGPGLELSDKGSRGGVGLRNTIDRLHASYGDSYKFTIKHRMGVGTTVSMQVPSNNIQLASIESY
jgi:two-component system LytT family sensor kinase